MIRVLCAGLLLMLSAPHAQAADNNSLPSAYRTVWATPSCENPAHITRYSAFFRLRAAPDTATIKPVTVTARSDGYIKVAEGNDILFLEITAKNRLQRTSLKIPNGIWPEKLDPGNPALDVTEWERCAHMPDWPSLSPDGLAAFAMLDDVRRLCHEDTITERCASGLFTAADMTRDGVLDYRDIAFGWRRLSYLSAAGRTDCPFTTQFPGGSAQEGPAFAAKVIAVNDNDHDRKLTRDESRQGVPDDIYPLLSPLRALIPAFSALPDAQIKCRP